MIPLSKDQWNLIVEEIRKTYSMKYGCLVQLRSKKKRRVPYSLCVSNMRNDGLWNPNYCVLWDDDKLLYQGKLDSGHLLNMLNRRHICCFEFTNVDNLENNIPGYSICFGCRESCDTENCKCKFEAYWQLMQEKHPQLTSPIVKIENKEAKSYILDAWNTGWKQARKNKLKREMEKNLESIRRRCSSAGKSHSDRETSSCRTEVQNPSSDSSAGSLWDTVFKGEPEAGR